jgi:hypothetical protein
MDIPIPTIPQAVVVALPLIVALITGLLGHVQLPSWVNAALAGLFVVLAAILSIALGQGFSTNPVNDFLLFAGYSAALISSPILKPTLDKLLVSTPSPLQLVFKPPAPLVTNGQGKTSSAATVGPSPIVLPTKQPPDMGG